MRLWIAPRVSSVTERHSSGNSMARDSGQGAMRCRGEYVPGSCTHRPSHHGSQ